MEKEYNFFKDDGTPLDPELLIKPGLCTTCVNDDDKSQYILCTLNRFDQMDEIEFKCYSYKAKT
jgi:hypothetical protein